MTASVRKLTDGRVLPRLALVALLSTSACATAGLYRRGHNERECLSCYQDPFSVSERQVDFRVLLVGDAGRIYDQPDQAPRAELRDLNLSRVRDAVLPGRTLLAWLGDNVYTHGVPRESDQHQAGEREQAEAVLGLQVNVSDNLAGVDTVFIPGNHDWDRSGDQGLERVYAEADLIESLAGAQNIALLPRDGCPGPLYLDYQERLRVILIDSEWLIRKKHPKNTESCEWGNARSLLDHDKRKTKAARSSARLASEPMTNELFYSRLDQLIAEAKHLKLDVLMLQHHPLETAGEHGYHVPLSQALASLGLIWPMRYGVIRSEQDLAGPLNKRMRKHISRRLQAAPGQAMIHASGHEHGLQVFEGPDPAVTLLVSGSGATAEHLGTNSDTLFKRSEVGYMRLDFLSDNRILLSVMGVESKTPLFAMWLNEP